MHSTPTQIKWYEHGELANQYYTEFVYISFLLFLFENFVFMINNEIGITTTIIDRNRETFQNKPKIKK